MSTSSSQFILDTIISTLEVDPDLNVVRVYRPDASDSTRTTVYPYIVSIQYRNDLEDSSSDGYCRANVEIICSSLVESDPSGQGYSAERAGLIVSKLKYLLENIDLFSIDENVDQYYRTKIDAIVVDGHIGNFNNNDSRITLGVATSVFFRMY